MGDNLQSQWDAVRSAPLLYLGAVIVIGGIIWAIIDRLYGGRMDGMNARMEGMKEELDRERRENERLRNAAAPPEPDTPAPSAKKAIAPLLTGAKPEKPNERVYLSKDMDTVALRKLCADKTRHQADAVVRPYIGKWIRLKGPVHEVWPKDGGGWTVGLKIRARGELLGSTMITFEESETPKLEILNKGDVIRAEGRIARIEELWVTLDHGRVLGDST
jgi:hypothetical protein